MKIKILQALLYIFCLQGLAQQPVTNSGNWQIHPGGSLSIAGSFTNTASANFLNNGSVYAKGSITSDQPAMIAGTGTIFLNGSTTQTIAGTTSFRTNHITTDNAGGFILNTDLSISGVHTFTNGIINTSVTPTYIIYENGATYTGDNDARHIAGWAKKVGATDFIFPVGNGTVERTIRLNSLTAPSEFAVRHNAPSPNPYQLITPLMAVNSDENWEVTKTYGGNASVTLTWDNSKVPFFNWTVADVRVAAYNGSNYWFNAGGSATGDASTGTITSNVVSLFNRFTFAGTSDVLPVTLIGFNAKRNNKYTEILWKTANENNIEYYTTERSDNGSYFYSLTQVRAHNLPDIQDYFVADKKTVNQYAYYRLKIVSTGGNIQYSSVIKVSNLNPVTSLHLQSNPVKSRLTLVPLNGLNGSFDYHIFSAGAQLVQKGKINIQSGGQVELPLRINAKPGSYTLTVSSKEQNFTIRFIVQ
ncbi:MAG: type sorting protein [Flavisolibacter sp.]|nr:type sorting protein [Flavisolibacter sp.]